MSDPINPRRKFKEGDGSDYAFFKLYRKRVIHHILVELSKFPEGKAKFGDYANRMRELWPSLATSIWRYQPALIKYQLIGFELDADNNKVIVLTWKGSEVLNHIRSITNLLPNKGDGDGGEEDIGDSGADSSLFFDHFHKHGCYLIMKILSEYPHERVRVADFNKRVQPILINPHNIRSNIKDALGLKLIAYELNEKGDKMLRLTEKGKEILGHIRILNDILKGAEK